MKEIPPPPRSEEEITDTLIPPLAMDFWNELMGMVRDKMTV